MRLSQEIRQVYASGAEGELVTMQTLLDRISHKSYGVFLVILALPSALPLPAPGYSMPFGIALFFLSVQMFMLREYPWFPERVLNRRIKGKANSRLRNGMLTFLGLVEKVIRPRLRFFYTNRLLYRGLGAVCMACAVSMCIPIPLTNTGPALGVFLIGIGMLEEDGLSALVGVAAAVAGILLTMTILVLIIFFGMEAIDMVREFLRGLLSPSEAPIELTLLAWR